MSEFDSVIFGGVLGRTSDRTVRTMSPTVIDVELLKSNCNNDHMMPGEGPIELWKLRGRPSR